MVVGFAYYAGRVLQLLGMWILLVDIVTAGPLGPAFNLFAVGIGIFLAGWFLVRRGTGGAR